MEKLNSDRGSVFGGIFWSVLFLSIAATLFTLLVLPGYVMRKQGTVSTRFDLQGSDKHQDRFAKYHPADAAEIAPVKGVHKPGLDLDALLSGSTEQLAAGKALFDVQCATCHGLTGTGDGPVGKALGARNMTLADNWVNGYQLTDIVGTLSGGLPPKMPSFEHLPPADRFNLAHYVVKLGTFKRAKLSAAAIQAMDEKYAFSKDQFAPNKVAVSIAMQQIDHENRGLLGLQLDRISTENSKLVSTVVQDPNRVIQSLNGIQDWRTDRDVFTRALIAGTPGNGFNTKLLALGGSQWRELHNALLLAVN